MISYNYWTRRFAQDPNVLGKTLYVNGVAITIVGVAAQGFEGVEAGGSTDSGFPSRAASSSMRGAIQRKTVRPTSPIRPGGVCG